MNIIFRLVIAVGLFSSGGLVQQIIPTQIEEGTKHSKEYNLVQGRLQDSFQTIKNRPRNYYLDPESNQSYLGKEKTMISRRREIISNPNPVNI